MVSPSREKGFVVRNTVQIQNLFAANEGQIAPEYIEMIGIGE